MRTFTLYTPPNQAQAVMPYEELLALATQGYLVARAEESGCEGCYVEVARCTDKPHSWRRFAFCKVFGGEDLSVQQQDAASPNDLTACRTAERIARRINGVASTTYIPLIHKLPTWGSEEAPCSS